MKPDSVDTEGSLHRLQLWGYLSVFVVVVVLGSWSALTSLSGAVIAPATIVTESNSKRIQHKDGGVVREILVRNGDRVGPGQKLVVLDDTETRSELSIVDALLIELLDRKAVDKFWAEEPFSKNGGYNRDARIIRWVFGD